MCILAVTAQAGIFGFGPQSAMESPATALYRHKATLIDLGVMDDIRVGPMEIGSGPFPTFPYKAGYIVGGGVELQPRLESSLGWLLYSALGDVATTGPVDSAYTHEFKPLASDQSFVRWLTLRKYIPMKEGDADTDIGEEYTDCKPTGLTLTLANDAPITARWDFMGRTFELVDDVMAGTPVVVDNLSLDRLSNVVTVVTDGNHGFHTGYQVVIAGVTPSSFNGTFNISEITNNFAILAADRASNIVTIQTDASHGLSNGDIVVVSGCTPSTFNGTFSVTVVDLDEFSYVNVGVDESTSVEGEVDFTPLDEFTYAQTGSDEGDSVPGTSTWGTQWVWENAYEDWGSIPVGCELGGHIEFTGGGMSGETLPVVGARVTFANQNLDVRQEKVYGSPFLEDITIISRQITFDVTIKWNNPELYKAILTGSTTGSEWSSRPLVGSLDITMVGTDTIGAGATKFSLGITAADVMWQMQGPIQLAGGQAVIMRFMGTALEPDVGDYATFTLINGESAYSWPV
jgi:hypothetical protein